MPEGIKSKHFGCYWKTMFLTAMCYPKELQDCEEHRKVKRRYKAYYNSFQYILPCRFCREFIQEVLNKTIPLDFSGRKELMKSIYLWKDAVNKKLIKQGYSVKPSPSFVSILRKYESYGATCNKSLGVCK